MLAFRPAAAHTAQPAARAAVRPATAPSPLQTPAPAQASAHATAGAGSSTIAIGAAAKPANDSLDWAGIIDSLDLQGAPRQLAANCVLLGREGATLRLGLDPRGASVRTRAQEEKLAQALSRHFGSPVRLEIQVQESSEDTPARSVERAQAERKAQARIEFEADPTVGALKQRFGASVLADTVRPAEPES
jgi:DNA polymerase-3 subunit gamma/tau